MANSPSNVTKKPKGTSPKPVDQSPRGIPSPELVRLQEELRNVKNELNCSDLEKARVQAEAAEARKQLAAVSNQLSETQSRLLDLSKSEDTRVRELRKISLERDKAWQSELEAVQKQKSLDLCALSSAMNEIKKLKLHLERVAEAEATQAKHVETAYHELRNIREELSETLVLVESLRNELCKCRDSEARTLETVGNTQMLLDIANVTAERLHSETMKAREALDAMSYKLERSRAREDDLEAAVRDLHEELDGCQSDHYGNAAETTEIGYYDHHLPAEVEVSKHWRSMPRTDDSKEVRKLTEENELLKEKLKKAGEDAAALLDAARSAEEEALTKLGNVMVEAGKNSERAAQVRRQLEATQAVNSETEAELRRLKLQLDQWRKAAELAATMISGRNDGKVTENRGSVEYSCVSDDDDTEKWRNGNVLKKIGVLWKKGNK